MRVSPRRSQGKLREGWYPEELKVTRTIVGGEIVYEGEG